MTGPLFGVWGIETGIDSHLLLVTLVVAFGAAFLGATIAARLRQSVILGYLLAGIAIGPFTPGPMGDVAAVQALADVGIIFLMFGIGVQLSLRELMAAGLLAIIGGPLQIVLTLGGGYVVGTVLGFDPRESIVFGSVIAISSTTVLTKILNERGELDAPHGRIALAWSAVQDVATVVLMLVLGALPPGGADLGPGVILAIGKAAIFIGLLIPLGSVALPWVFNHVAALRNREVFLLSIAALAFGTAYGASFFGLSVALGAFLAGMVVSESDLSHQILGEIAPLRDLFAGLFFVSVGMLVDPSFVAQNLPMVSVLVAAITLLKGGVTAAIVALARHPVRTSILTGVLLGQAGEFSFLLARLGVDLGVATLAGFNLMLAGTAVSVGLSPLLDQAVRPLLQRLEGRLRVARPAEAADDEPDPGILRGHAVLCGYGRVGRVIGTALRRRNLRLIVIEEERRIVQELRERGVPALLGNAANATLLERARVKDARVLIVAIPDPLAARQIVDYAQALNQRLDIVVRTHNLGEVAFMQSRAVSEVVMGETELALEMTRHALHRFGVSSPEVLAAIAGLRERLSQGQTLED